MKKFALLFLALIIGVSVSGADKKEEALAGADMIEVWDIRSHVFPKTPEKITDIQTITAIVSTIRKSPAKWKSGWGTSPAGNIRFGFKKGSEMIEAIGMGDGFLVRGGGGNWETKKISKEIEAELWTLLLQKKPSQAAQTTPGLRPSVSDL